MKGLVGLGVKVFGEMADVKVDEPFKQLLFNATKKYVQTYTDRHGHVQVLGMSKSIPLDDIYSGARMLDSEAMKSYSSQADLEKNYRNRGQRRFRDYNCPKRNGIEIAKDKECDRLIVLGDPGIGKSTFLRKIGLEALKGTSGEYHLPYIPVFLELKRFRSKEVKVDLKASITEEFKSCGFPSSEGFTENALKKGQLLLLFDGLDEVPADNLDPVIESIQDLVDRYSGNRFIASCRIAAYHTYFKRVNTVAIAEFDDDQIKQFIHNWFSSELDQENQTAEQCWGRLKQPKNKGAKELAQSPLLLTFLCMVYNKSLTVPSNRTTLYGRALDILLEEWATEKRVGRGEIYEGFHSDLEKELLAKIAYDGFENDQLFFSKEQITKSIADFLGDTLDAPKNLNASAVLDAVEVQQGILVERATEVYSFSHLTLQEFLTAKYIVTWSLQDDLVELHVQDDRWREVFFLVTGL
ncbi:NACHT domain-containing protein, partial [Acaryochloris marina NIES-2412]|uniref:NACHT domain-containing protein n=1 Tax=Acaryochloris marina TaxID=155978 RepID=UPI004059B7FF